MNTNLLTQYGFLKVMVYEFSVGKPIDNANIRIIPHRDDTKIIADLVTDTSGQTAIIDLPAPPVEYSLDSATGQKPYSEYDIIVSREGFETHVIEGVQVLPYCEAIQEVSLQAQVSSEPVVETMSIEQHTLWNEYPSKIPEADVKELPPSLGFVVLPEPVVPEYIVVHTGAPSNKSATNHWVPYKDYIKNVASSEIYANWPVETIKANVLAIISFTLNRVYTEWYRSKGHDFTITNSTAYDHAFVYGRNIFEEISRVVDDIFTTFITKPNIQQPLLTQYCDGKRVHCPNWMTQWGSKALGDQGYSAVDILKSFYGYDIFLMNAKTVQGVPSSFHGTVLQAGSNGQDVKTIQKQLNAISKNYPAIPKIPEDGIYGDQTLAAVDKFQHVFNLPSSGMVDFSTWYKISDIYVAVSRIAELG